MLSRELLLRRLKLDWCRRRLSRLGNHLILNQIVNELGLRHQHIFLTARCLILTRLWLQQILLGHRYGHLLVICQASLRTSIILFDLISQERFVFLEWRLGIIVREQISPIYRSEGAASHDRCVLV